MSEANNPGEEPVFMSHLIELRDRLLRSVLVVFVILLPLLFFSADLFTYLTVPIMAVLPEGQQLIAIDVASPFLAPFKLAIFTAIFLAIPYLLYQAWSFIAPGLYQNERKLVVPLLISSTLLFYAGIAFAYLVVFKLVFGFFYAIAPEVVNVTPDINSYLDFTIKMFFAFGISFEVPIATILFCWTGMTTPDKLADKRRYFIVGVLIVSMLMTPPDVVSQLLLGIPMWLLFEAGIFFARRILPKRNSDDDDDVEDEEENSIMPNDVAAKASTTVSTGVGAAEPPAEPEAKTESEPEFETEEEFEEPYVEPTDEEIEAEFDRIEAEEDDDEDDDGSDPQSLEPEKKPE